MRWVDRDQPSKDYIGFVCSWIQKRKSIIELNSIFHLEYYSQPQRYKALLIKCVINRKTSGDLKNSVIHRSHNGPYHLSHLEVFHTQDLFTILRSTLIVVKNCKGYHRMHSNRLEWGIDKERVFHFSLGLFSATIYFNQKLLMIPPGGKSRGILEFLWDLISPQSLVLCMIY